MNTVYEYHPYLTHVMIKLCQVTKFMLVLLLRLYTPAPFITEIWMEVRTIHVGDGSPMHCPRMCVPCWSLTKFERCGMRFENTTGVGGVTLTLDVQSGDYSILLKNTCILQDVCLYSLSSLFMYYLSSFPLVHVFPDVPSSFHYRHMQNWVFQLLA